MHIPFLPHGLPTALLQAIEHNVKEALAEDLGGGDHTAQLIPAAQTATARIISRETAVICGMPWAQRCFTELDPAIQIDWLVSEGDGITAGQTLCEIRGNARAMLSAERCALNFLQMLSGTATLTQAYVQAVAGTGVQILDTRKTLPGLRLAQKYAVRAGGGFNQRIGLYDGILIKENHINAAGSIAAALEAAHHLANEAMVQIEVENLDELQDALDAGAKLILLDNFDPENLCAAVSVNNGRAVLEASGGIDLAHVREIALTGVDRISVGGLTKNVRAVDLSMRFS